MIDKGVSRDFLQALFGKTWAPLTGLVWWTPARRSRWASSAERAAEIAADLSKAAAGVYFGCCLGPAECATREDAHKRRILAEEVAGMPGLWLDIDIEDGAAHKKAGLPRSIAEAEELLWSMGPVPSIVVHSGHGLQAYWLFHELLRFDDEGGAELRAEAAAVSERWNRRAIGLAASRGWQMDSCYDLARVMRIPGTVNRKKGCPEAPARLLTFEPERRYSFADLAALVESVQLAGAPQAELPATRESVSPSVSEEDARAEVEASRAAAERKVVELPRPKVAEAEARPRVSAALKADAEKAVRKREAVAALTRELAPHVRPGVEVPREKLQIALGNLGAKFRKTWERLRPDMKDQSQSGYDLSLCLYLEPIGWTAEELVAAMIEHKRRTDPKGPEPKRPVDYARAIVTAREMLQERADSDAEAQEIVDAIEAGPGAILELLRKKLELPITGFVSRGTAKPSFYLVLEGRREILLGRARDVLSFGAVEAVLMEATRTLVPYKARGAWRKLCEALMALQETVDPISEGARDAELRTWIRDYLENSGTLTDCRAATPEGREEFCKAFTSKLPYRDGTRVAINAGAFQKYLRTEAGPTFDESDLRLRLSEIGFRAYRQKVKTDGATINRGYWVGEIVDSSDGEIELMDISLKHSEQ